MTSRLLMPRRRLPASGDGPELEVAGGVAATRILDWGHPRVACLADEVRGVGEREWVREAHRLIGDRIRPVYAMNDEQPVSVTVRRGRGSCSQRMAVLEAVARARGIATRVRGRVIDGAFWYARFPGLRALVPDEVVLAWPEFRVEGRWVAVSEIYDGLCVGSGFDNAGAETLFDAVARTAVDWDGTVAPTCDLSARVVADLGYFGTRDELFREYGQTLRPGVRWVVDLMMSWRGVRG
ncbi:transglutaminase domain-containing protein [Nonomuraea salmonea]|uniref:Transglutaminase domain-containing protein n=1 Tax=Nonomuraea salmonea TaxID=46181 RepID=A0ABV5NW13_9ACTN